MPIMVHGQCNLIGDNGSDQATDRPCAPVTLTMDVNYSFLYPVSPDSTVEILYVWNDGTGATTTVPAIPNGTGKIFTASESHIYPPGNTCSYTAESFLVFNGKVCSSSRQEQTFISWARDNENGGQVSTDPEIAYFCEGDSVHVLFRDDSEFNCNPNVEPDRPNVYHRWVQFIYGTHTTPGTRIPNVQVYDDISHTTIDMTDGDGNALTTYEGPVQRLEMPVNGPISVAFPIYAPPGGVNGDIFEITLRNWNICNPYDTNVVDGIPPSDPDNGDFPPISTVGLIKIDETPTPVIVSPGEFCTGDPLTLSATGQNVKWYGDSLLTNLLYEGTNFDLTSPPSNINNSVSGKYSFWLTDSSGRCVSDISKTGATVHDQPDPADAGKDTSICTSSINLYANSPVIGSGYWTTTGTATIADTANPNTLVTNLDAGANIFTWNTVNGPCISSDDVIVYRDIQPDPAFAGFDLTVCQTGIATLNATAPNHNGKGTWTIIQGSGIISSPGDPVSVVTGLAQGNNRFAWTVSSEHGGCPETTDTIAIIRDLQPSPANAGPDREVCDTSEIVLSAQSPDYNGSGSWNVTSGNGTFNDTTDPGTTIKNIDWGETQITWTVTSQLGICPSTTDTVTISRYQSPGIINAGTDQALCNTLQSLPMDASIPARGNAHWEIVSQPTENPPTFTPSALDKNAVLSVSNGNEGQYILVWVAVNGTCTSQDTVIIDLGKDPPPADAGPGSDICGLSASLSAELPSYAKGSWQKLTGPGTLYFSPTAQDPSASVSINQGDEGIYLLKWTIESGSCSNQPQHTDTVEINFRVQPEQPLAHDTSLCGTSDITLQADMGKGGTINRWYTSMTSATPVHEGITYPVTGISSSTTYYVSSYNDTSTCESPRVPLNITINPIPGLPLSNDKTSCGSETFQFTSQAGAHGTTTRWYSSPTALTPIHTGDTLNSPVISTTTSYYYSSYNEFTQCESNRNEVRAIVYPVPDPPAITTGERCGLGNITLSSTPGNNATTTRWYDYAGINILATSNVYTTPVIDTTTHYKASSFNDTTGCESSVNDISAVIHPVPEKPVVPDADRCGEGNVLVDASLPTHATTNRWYHQVTGGTHFANMEDLDHFFGTTTYLYVGGYNDSTGCEGERTQTLVTIKDLPSTSPITGPEIAGKGQTNLVYSVDSHSGSTYTWNIPDSVNTILTSKNIAILEFPYTGYYTIAVQETAANGCPGIEQTKNILVKEDIIDIDLNTGEYKTCRYEPLRLTATPSGGTPAYTFHWTGDTFYLSSTKISNPDFDTRMPGNYSLFVKITDINGYSVIDTIQVEVYPNPSAKILTDDTVLCGGTLFSIPTMVSGGSGDYPLHYWTGNTRPLSDVTSRSPVFQAHDKEIFPLNYHVVDSRGCTNMDSVTIKTSSPKARFTTDAEPSCSPVKASFTNNSEDALHYSWNFNDGTSSEEENPVHDFNNTGTSIRYFEVKLQVTDTFGCVDETVGYVTVYPNPNTDISLYPEEACDPAWVTLSATPGGLYYDWDFGDGERVTTGFNSLHQYTNTTEEDTIYRVKLITTTAFNCRDTSYADMLIHPSPTAGFEANPREQMYPETTINITNTTEPGKWDYKWDLGDGTIINDAHPGAHSYDDLGNYTIRLYVSNENCTDSVIKSVSIVPHPPVAVFDSVGPGCMPLTVNFENKSLYSTSCLWEFGDGSVSNKPNPTYTYYESGKYKIKLTVFGPGGADSKSQVNEVYVLPNAFFDIAPKIVYLNDEKVHFFNLSDNGDIYLWDFGDGNTSTEMSPKHEYKEEGVYSVTLQVWTNKGCFDLYEMENAVAVKPSGKIAFPNVFSPVSGIEENRVFYPGLLDNVMEYHLMIFNRWGDLLFESFDPDEGWDGTYNGQPAKQDVYVWKVIGKYTDGHQFVKTGDVTLLY
ncbi:MAG: PKD domain-containing protein [Bacteroidales bacterium]